MEYKGKDTREGEKGVARRGAGKGTGNKVHRQDGIIEVGMIY